MKLIPAADSFVCKSAVPAASAAEQNYKICYPAHESYYSPNAAYWHRP